MTGKRLARRYADHFLSENRRLQEVVYEMVELDMYVAVEVPAFCLAAFEYGLSRSQSGKVKSTKFSTVVGTILREQFLGYQSAVSVHNFAYAPLIVETLAETTDLDAVAAAAAERFCRRMKIDLPDASSQLESVFKDVVRSTASLT